jgi:hypothetical protein
MSWSGTIVWSIESCAGFLGGVLDNIDCCWIHAAIFSLINERSVTFRQIMAWDCGSGKPFSGTQHGLFLVRSAYQDTQTQKFPNPIGAAQRRRLRRL